MFNCDSQKDFDSWLAALNFNECLDWLLNKVLYDELQEGLHRANVLVWIA